MTLLATRPFAGAILVLSSVALVAPAAQASGSSTSIPSVVVKIRNLAPSRATFLTPPWIAIHDGTFDSYDGGQAASVPLGGDEIERLAEDGDTASISATFEALMPGAPQATVLGPAGPFAPGETQAITLNLDPSVHRYFSYASMIIPSNDAFVANGNPLAHQLFDEDGDFVGEEFFVSGDETNDAGTEVNDEDDVNVAFLNQSAPNTGLVEGGLVVTPHPGFAAAGSLTYPDGILNYPVFANSGISTSSDRLLGFEFVYVDLGRSVRFTSDLSPGQELQADPVDSEGSGSATLRSRRGEEVEVRIRFRRLTGPLIAAHLHLGQAGVNGPVVVDLEDGIRGRDVRFTVKGDDLVGPLAGRGVIALLNELAAGNIYINLHTDDFPAGEIRGQVELRRSRRRGHDD